MCKRILVVEDNPADQFLMKSAIQCSGLTDYSMEVAEDGEEALETLRKAGQEKPALIVLDLNLPKTGGIDVLRSIRQDPQLSKTVVVTWTSSVTLHELLEVRELGVDAHVVKPTELEEYMQIGKNLCRLLTQRTSAEGEA